MHDKYFFNIFTDSNTIWQIGENVPNVNDNLPIFKNSIYHNNSNIQYFAINQRNYTRPL